MIPALPGLEGRKNMYSKILKKDLKRKKSMNFILLLFIFLATTFIATSLNNLSVVMNGVNYFMEISGVQDYLIITMGGGTDGSSQNEQNMEEFLDQQKDVEDYDVDEILYLADYHLEPDSGKEFESHSTNSISCYKIRQQKFFDEKNREITQMKSGTIYLSRKAFEENDLQAGDRISIHAGNGYRKTFTIQGYCKDVFLGSDMMSLQRFIVSEEDYREMADRSDFPSGKIYSVRCDDVTSFKEEFDNTGLMSMFSGDQSWIQKTYIMDMVIAAVLLLVSLCLVIISLVMLRFMILFTVNEDYQEIGIMKAIGIRDGGIRKLYLVKYFLIAVCGAVPGFLISIPFSNLLLAQVTQSIVIPSGRQGLWRTFCTSVLVVLIVVFCGYLSTGKIKKFSPMDAIRSGNNGERFKRKGLLHLAGSRWNDTTFLAGNDVISELRKYMVLLITSIVGVWLVIMPVDTINTLCSERIVRWMGVVDSDIYLVDDGKSNELICSGKRQNYYDYLEEIKTSLQKEQIDVSRVIMDVMFRVKIRHDDISYTSFSLQGLGTETDEYFYDDGTPPKYANEVAITHVIAQKLHVGIGDTVWIYTGKEEKPFVVTALYQSMNNFGEGIRFPEEVEIDYSFSGGNFGVQIVLEERPDGEEYQALLSKMEKIFPKAKIYSVVDYIQTMLGGISDKIESFKILILTIVLVINILVVVLMQKMFLIRERTQVGMLKLIGFSDASVICWQTKRIMMVLFAGILLGTITATPFSQLTSGKVFQMMGASRIEFEINPLEVYVVYPIILFVVTVLACMITMLKVRKTSAIAILQEE